MDNCAQKKSPFYTTAPGGSKGLINVEQLSETGWAGDANQTLIRLRLRNTGVTCQMKIHVAEQRVDGGEALKVVARVQFIGHAHPAVQLHRYRRAVRQRGFS